jgi:hypothetical protein
MDEAFAFRDSRGRAIKVKAPEMRVVVDPKAKLGHASPCCGGTNQLYQGDHGLTCPNCNTVFVAKKAPEPEEPEADEPEEKKAHTPIKKK